MFHDITTKDEKLLLDAWIKALEPLNIFFVKTDRKMRHCFNAISKISMTSLGVIYMTIKIAGSQAIFNFVLSYRWGLKEKEINDKRLIYQLGSIVADSIVEYQENLA